MFFPNLLKLLLASILLLIGSHAIAQTRAKSAHQFVGIIQHVSGQPQWMKRPKRSLDEKIAFQTFLGYGDWIRLPKGTRIKLVTSQRCVGVVYGPGVVIAPASGHNSVWHVEKASTRWICKKGQTQQLRLDDKAISVKGGEVFYHNRTLLVKRGRVLGAGGRIRSKQTYVFENNNWAIDAPKDRPFLVWKFDQELPLPKESKKWKRPKKKAQSRWVVSPIFGGGGLKHENDHLSMDSLDMEGLRLMTNHKMDNWSMIAALNYFELSNPQAKNDSEFIVTDDPNRYNDLNSFAAELGARFNHERSWSFFAKAGIAEQVYNIQSKLSTLSLNREEVYLSATLSAGVDKILFADSWGWGGLYLSAEVFVTRSLFHTETKSSGGEFIPTPTPDEARGLEGGLTSFGIMFGIGPMLQF